MDPKKNCLYRKIAIVAIAITLILFLCLPSYSSWVPESWDGWEAGWNEIYIYEDEFILIGLLPFYIFFPLMLFTKNRTLKIVFKIVLFLLAGLYFAYGLLATGLPAQDYAPGPGTYLLLALLPELSYLYYMDMWVKYNKENPKVESAS